MCIVKPFKRAAVLLAVLAAALLMWAAPAWAAGAGGPRVLFITSYSYAWPTVPQQLQGIQDALGEDVTLTVRCMDTKSINTSVSQQLFYQQTEHLLNNSPPYDAVIVGDDDALKFVNTHRDTLFADLPVVFEGINKLDVARAAQSDPLTTGVVEQISYSTNMALALQINPTAKKVVAILDDTVTGEGERAQFYAQAEQYPQLEFGEINVSLLTEAGLQQKLAAVQQDTILIYLIASADSNGKSYTNHQICSMIAQYAPVPCYRFVSAGIGCGVLGGYVVSHYESGAIAGRMVSQILNGTDLAAIPVQMDSPTQYLLDYAVVQKFGIPRSALPRDAEYLNYVPTFWQANGRTVLITAAVMLFAFAVLAAVLYLRAVGRTNELLARKNEELAEVTAEAEHASKAKGRFLSNITHELRTPISAISGSVALARQHVWEAHRVEEYLNRIDNASQALIGIVNDVLDMAAIENEKLRIAREPFSLRQVMDGIRDMYAEQCAGKYQRFELQFDPSVTQYELVGDALRLSQILMNLMSNACKFTPPGGSIQLTVSQPELSAGQAVLEFKVADTGCGMSSEMKARLYQPFEQEDDATAARHGGSGLGLAITKNLVEWMNGSIDCQSAKWQGTTFTVRLPFGCPATEISGRYRMVRAIVGGPNRQARAPVGNLLTYLGVPYDETDSRQLMGMLTAARAEGRPYNVGFACWQQVSPDVMEQTRAARRLFDSIEIPIVAVGEEDSEEMATQAIAAGANEYVAAPLQEEKVRQVLEAVVERMAQHRAENEYDFTGHRVLMVEDEDMSAEVAIELLHRAHLEVDRAENGEQAVEQFSSAMPGTYSAILMDIRMPVMDGYEAARAIRISGHPQAKTIPIIAVSARAFSDSLTAVISAGMNDHVAKPIRGETLLHTLEKYLHE